MAAATDLLRSFNIDAVLEAAADCSKKGLKFDANRFWSEMSTLPATTAAQTRPPQVTKSPLEVAVSGLMCGVEGLEATTKLLNVEVCDHTHRLGPLYEALGCAYRSIHLHDDEVPGGAKNSEASLKRKKDRAYSKFCVRLVDTGLCVDRHSTPPPSRRRPSLPEFDARELIKQCKDRVWIDKFRLDRLSICQMGVTKRVHGGIDSEDELSEVFSVPLP